MNYTTKQGLGESQLDQFSVHRALFMLKNRELLNLYILLLSFAKAMLRMLQQLGASIKRN